MTGDEWTTDFEWKVANRQYSHFWELPDGYPARVVVEFSDAARVDPVPLELLSSMITPECRDDLGDLSKIIEYFRQGPFVFFNHRYISDVLDVVYVKLVEVDRKATQRPSQEPQRLTYVTLVWRPELDGWKIYRIGEPVLPGKLRRTSPGNAPSY